MTKQARGQGLVEFALVAPIFLAVVFGVIAASYLFFQNTAVNSGAQGGAREVLVHTTLVSGGCETSTPELIETAVQKAANILPVDTNQLCVSGSDPNELVQTPQSGTASITVVGNPSLSSPVSFTVTVTYLAHPLEPLLGTQILLKSTSTLDVQQTSG
ncbi:MAG TPA: TadE/TadG family type IV pilus assembly protein [Candidatus Dormibacteraeota bacterium]